MRLISASEECGDDVVRICGSRKYKRNNNFEILACLVNNEDVRCVNISFLLTNCLRTSINAILESLCLLKNIQC